MTFHSSVHEPSAHEPSKRMNEIWPLYQQHLSANKRRPKPLRIHSIFLQILDSTQTEWSEKRGFLGVDFMIYIFPQNPRKKSFSIIITGEQFWHTFSWHGTYGKHGSAVFLKNIQSLWFLFSFFASNLNICEMWMKYVCIFFGYLKDWRIPFLCLEVIYWLIHTVYWECFEKCFQM